MSMHGLNRKNAACALFALSLGGGASTVLAAGSVFTRPDPLPAHVRQPPAVSTGRAAIVDSNVVAPVLKAVPAAATVDLALPTEAAPKPAFTGPPIARPLLLALAQAANATTPASGRAGGPSAQRIASAVSGSDADAVKAFCSAASALIVIARSFTDSERAACTGAGVVPLELALWPDELTVVAHVSNPIRRAVPADKLRALLTENSAPSQQSLDAQASSLPADVYLVAATQSAVLAALGATDAAGLARHVHVVPDADTVVELVSRHPAAIAILPSRPAVGLGGVRLLEVVQDGTAGKRKDSLMRVVVNAGASRPAVTRQQLASALTAAARQASRGSSDLATPLLPEALRRLEAERGGRLESADAAGAGQRMRFAD